MGLTVLLVNLNLRLVGKALFIYASVTATANNAASARLPTIKKGKVTGVCWSIVNLGGEADGDYLRCELSFASTRQNSLNDAQGVISVCGSSYGFTTSGAAQHAVNFGHDCNLDFEPLQTVYLHAEENGAANYAVTACVYYE